MDFKTAEERYRREGFELAAELILDRLDDCKTVEEGKVLINKILMLMREKRLVQVSQEIGLG